MYRSIEAKGYSALGMTNCEKIRRMSDVDFFDFYLLATYLCSA